MINIYDAKFSIRKINHRSLFVKVKNQVTCSVYYSASPLPDGWILLWEDERGQFVPAAQDILHQLMHAQLT